MLQITTTKGLTEATIAEDCLVEKFYTIANILQSKFALIFIQKLEGPDTLYWDFVYKESTLVLHYNIYTGVTIFPLAFSHASNFDNDNVVEIATLIIQEFTLTNSS